MNDLDQALEALRRLHPRKIDLGLGRIQAVLDALGHPEAALPTAVHVAGTNGKGSTVALLRAMIEGSSASAHVYTSPHLVHFNERIRVAGSPIDDAHLINVLERVRAANDDAPLSFFEATTAAAFLAFSEQAADFALIEVGLGGRYDATNVFIPNACAITPIDLDHAEFLGRDILGIAKEKAGIMKRGVPVFIGPQPHNVREVLRAEAEAIGAPVNMWGEDFRAYRQQGRLVYETDHRLLDLPLPALAGDHQIMNAGLAISVAIHLGLTSEAISRGLETVSWPARMQPLRRGALVEIASDIGAELWLDGGHNPHAARALSAHMAGLESRSPRPLILLMGILANKDAGGYLDFFEGLASGLVAVTIDDHASLSPETLTELGRARGMECLIGNNLTDAMRKAIHLGKTIADQTAEATPVPPRILICGSLYLAGQVLADNS